MANTSPTLESDLIAAETRTTAPHADQKLHHPAERDHFVFLAFTPAEKATGTVARRMITQTCLITSRYGRVPNDVLP